MAAEFQFDDKGKVKPKQSQEASPQVDPGHLTRADMGKPDPATLTQMQRTVGNAAVQRFLAQRSGAGPTELDDATAETINHRRGGGSQLDEGMAVKAGGVMGQDFSGVKVHTDSTADNLSRQLGAKAFTTGSDIFFRSGQYDPASSGGQELISHELTHVAQQGASAPSVQSKMTVNDPNDKYEAEADAVAQKVMSKEDDTAVQRQEEEEELQMQEEEEELQMQEEEEELQMQEEEEELQMQEEEEELQMQEEEEELQMQED
jgi:hypothetical protein